MTGPSPHRKQRERIDSEGARCAKLGAGDQSRDREKTQKQEYTMVIQRELPSSGVHEDAFAVSENEGIVRSVPI